MKEEKGEEDVILQHPYERVQQGHHQRLGRADHHNLKGEHQEEGGKDEYVHKVARQVLDKGERRLCKLGKDHHLALVLQAQVARRHQAREEFERLQIGSHTFAAKVAIVEVVHDDEPVHDIVVGDQHNVEMNAHLHYGRDVADPKQ